jgi:hypothetical protein
MKRTIPLLITAIGGFVLFVAFFIPALQSAGEAAAIWFDILASIAFVLGGGNLMKLQLQKISDRASGWGYSVLILASFLATLFFGLLKLGCPPEQSVEAYGTSSVNVPISALPEFRVPAPFAIDTTEHPFPKSVRLQTQLIGGEISFRGWPTPQQVEDLKHYSEKLEWKCAIEQLADRARPPQMLQGKIVYEPDSRLLSFMGMMATTEQNTLLASLPDSAESRAAVSNLAAIANRTSSIRVRHVPKEFAIPPEAQAAVQLVDNQLQIRGPMTVKLRDHLAKTWCHYPPARPLPDADQSRLVREIERLGPPLTDGQIRILKNLLSGEWSADQLIQAINTAGIPRPVFKTSCELLAEIQAGSTEPVLTKPAAEPALLNAPQEQVIETFVRTPSVPFDQLQQQLSDAGPLTREQQLAIDNFAQALPTQAERRKELCFKLLEEGPLSTSQREFLLSGFRDQFAWRQDVGRLFLAAHRVKYPWSGNYSAQGSPFWWLYEYVFQPLLTTTFAVLAFYVASAAYRAFRAKNLEAVLLLGTAFIILLGRTPAGPFLTQWIPERFSAFKIDSLTVYIMSIFNTAGNRAIMIGIALGIVSTSLKVLLGIDRSYLGSGDD